MIFHENGIKKFNPSNDIIFDLRFFLLKCKFRKFIFAYRVSEEMWEMRNGMGYQEKTFQQIFLILEYEIFTRVSDD